jgi:hypothetical protein
VGETVLADGVAQRAGESGQAPGEGDFAAAGGELAGGEGGDVPVPELVELEGAEAGDEVVADVVPVAGHGGRLEHEALGGEPGVEVVGDGLVRVGVEPARLALEESEERGLCAVLAWEAAAADGRAAVIRGGGVDGEGPRAVFAVRDQPWTVRAELVTVNVSAAAAAVDTTVAGGGCCTHRGRLQCAAGYADTSSLRPLRPPGDHHGLGMVSDLVISLERATREQPFQHCLTEVAKQARHRADARPHLRRKGSRLRCSDKS